MEIYAVIFIHQLRFIHKILKMRIFLRTTMITIKINIKILIYISIQFFKNILWSQCIEVQFHLIHLTMKNSLNISEKQIKIRKPIMSKISKKNKIYLRIFTKINIIFNKSVININ